MSKISITIRPDPNNDKGHIHINGNLEDLPKIQGLINKYIDPKIKKEIQELNK